jgi:hypothetical protein
LDKDHVVIVRVLRDPHGCAEPWFFEKTRDFQQVSHVERRAIQIATYEPKDFHAALVEQEMLKPDVVILNSELNPNSNTNAQGQIIRVAVIGPNKCPAFISEWSKGESKIAAQEFVTFLAGAPR